MNNEILDMRKHNFKESTVWQKARQLVIDVYKITKFFPYDEKYALTSQVKRSVVSIPSNIAEVAGMGTKKDFAHFLNISYGSANELESQLINTIDLKFINKEQLKEVYNLLMKVQKMIYTFQKTLR